MKCASIIEKLQDLMPYTLAMDWDNVGLLVGSSQKEVKKVLLGLDLTNEMLDFAIKEEVDLIITHHPLIFSSIKVVNDDSILGRKILSLIKNDISYIALHTNYDIAKDCMTKASFKRLGLEFCEVFCEEKNFANDILGIGGIANLQESKTLYELASIFKEKLELAACPVYGNLEDSFDKLAVLPGSGKGMYKEAIKKGIKLLVSGDISHHDGIDALEGGVSIIDVGHYGMEKVFIDDMQDKIKGISEEIEVLKYDKDERKFI